MKYKFLTTVLLSILIAFNALAQKQEAVKTSEFQKPNNEFRPMPFWHINGEMTDEGIIKQVTDAKRMGFGGVAVLPVDQTLPEYLSDAYFKKYQLILETATKLGMQVILYDDTGFPSGTAGGIIERDYPQFLRKSIEKTETNVTKLPYFKSVVPSGQLMAAVAMNMETKERINLKPFIKNNLLSWRVPKGNDWRVLFFNNRPATFWKTNMPLDAMDPAAMEQFMKITYDEYAKRFSSYFGNTIKMTYFDDVGFLRRERTWTGKFNEKFIALNGYEPDLLYPALWYDIGEETASARVALFNTRSELLAEGYPKSVTEWTKKYGLTNTGHPPGNYDIQPVDMHGDIFKFFRYTPRPLTDAIIYYGHGREGFKLISSAADLYDRPIVSTEVFGAFKENTVDVNMLYRTMMELFVRGVNFVVPHGEWYVPEKMGIPPLFSPYSEKLAPALPAFSDYIARSSYLLQGGRKISEIGIVYPISSLQAGYYFDAPDNKGPAGDWAYPDADYLKLSDILTNEIRRDFTFLHPEYLATDKYKISAGNLHLDNAVDFQDYKIVIIPGGEVIALNTLQKIKSFYDKGGKVIGTTLLPSKSTKKGEDEQIEKLVATMFGKESASDAKTQSNTMGGKAIFVKNPTKETLENAIEKLSVKADIVFENVQPIKSELGLLSYLHKVKDGKDIYFFANSSDDTINTTVLLRGKHNLQSWNPNDGKTSSLKKMAYVIKDKEIYTKYSLQLPAVKSVFWVTN
jgi:hypothetical protein